MKKCFKIFVFLMFVVCLFIGCKGQVESKESESAEVDEPDDLTLLDKVQRLFSDDDIAGLTQTVSDLDNYDFPSATYKCQFLISSEHDGVQVIQSFIWQLQGNAHGGSLSKISNYTVLVASSKSAKQKYNIDNLYSEYFDIGSSSCFEGWKGLIGLYDEGGKRPSNLYGCTVTSIINKILQNASSIQTNEDSDKYYVHKTVNGTDIQVCMIKEI